MRASQFLIATTKETPADAELASHQLMLRSGMIRKLAAGIYTWLPMGLRVLRKVENIVREEMDNAGGQEILMPAVQPAELWEQSGRWNQYGGELLRVKDRHNRDFCIGPTHEEVVSTMARNEIRSYKQLPLNFYQIQTKFRDERRPRFGIMRSREFIMKDAYSFHASQESLQETYDLMHATYTKIFERLSLGFAPVEADNGSIGGNASHEFHVLADSGEDAIAVCEKYNYAANVELAEALAIGADRAEPKADLSELATPNLRTIDDIVSANDIAIEKTVKTLLVEGAEVDGKKIPAIALVLRGDHELNEIKAEKHPMVASPLRWLTDDEIKATVNCSPGSIGVVNLEIPVIADRSASNLSDFTCGANKDDLHFINVNWVRDCAEPETFDLRLVNEGDICARADNDDSEEAKLTIKRGIEVGHIFQLGTKYSEAMNATCLDSNGKAIAMPMGCYGIGVSRIVAAAIEQNYDDNGIIWPEAIAPFEVVIVGIGYTKSETVKNTCDELYQGLKDLGIDVLLDDRKERPGIMFADAELMGIPHRLVVGDKSLERGIIEYKERKTSRSEDINYEGILETIKTLFNK